MIVLDAVERFLDEHGLGRGPLAARRIGEGSSNATFLLERQGERFVLRRPPRPPFPRSAHDVLREARLQQALLRAGVRVPQILAVADDPALLGVPFYVSEHIAGHVVTRTLPRLLEGDDARRAMLDDVVCVLAEIHGVDTAAPDIAQFVRPGSYLERQIRRFGELWGVNATRDVPEISELASWLERTRPEELTPTVVHGDFRIGNVMLAPDEPVRVAAVLDWELGAIGDPRADLGYLLATYSHAGSPQTPLELTPVTARRGFPAPEALVERYVELTSRSVAGLPWFEVLALWKGAIFCEEIYGRYVRGELDHDPFAASLGPGVPELARAAARIASQL